MVDPLTWRVRLSLAVRFRVVWLGLCLALWLGWATACSRRPVVSEPLDAEVQYSVDALDRLPRALTIPLYQHNGYLRLPTRINGRDAHRFLFDTGSAKNALAVGIDSHLGLATIKQGTARGIAGTETFTYTRVASLSIGPLGLVPHEMPTLDLYRFSPAIGDVVSGIIGFSALRDLPFSIDYQANTLTAYRPSGFQPPLGAALCPLRVHRGVPVVQAVLNQRHRVWLIVDTGSDAHIALPTVYAQRWPRIVDVPLTGRARSKGIGGWVGGHQSWLGSVQVLGRKLTDVPVTFENPPPGQPDQHIAMGRIGHAMLKHFRLTFDAPNGRLWAQWQPDRSLPQISILKPSKAVEAQQDPPS